MKTYKVILKDNVLKENECKEIYKDYDNNISFNQNIETDFYSKKRLVTSWFYNEEIPKNIKKLIDISSQEFDLSDMLGIEMWVHQNSTSGVWHQDTDEYLWADSKILSFPICSLAYYPYVSDKLVGGNFTTNDFEIEPKTNSLIIFSSDIWHIVPEFKGERFAVLICPWRYRPKLI
jgi:hypothetical protein